MLIYSTVLKLQAQTLVYKKVYYILGQPIMRRRNRRTRAKSIIFILSNLKIKNHIQSKNQKKKQIKNKIWYGDRRTSCTFSTVVRLYFLNSMIIMFLWWWNACNVLFLRLDLRIKKYVLGLFHRSIGLLDIKNNISGWKFL